MLRRILLCLLILGAVFLERSAAYGARSIAFLWMTREFGEPAAMMGRIWTWVGLLGGVAPFFGAACAAVLPARWVAVAGVAGSALAFALLALAHGEGMALFALAALAFAGGLFRPAILVSAGAIFRRDLSSAAFFCLLYGATNAAAMISSLVSGGALRTEFGERPVFAGACALAVIATILAAAAAAIPHFLREDDEAEEPADERRPAAGAWPWIATLAVIALTAPATTLLTVQDNVAFSRASSLGAGSAEILFQINPAVVISISLLLAALLAALGFAKLRVPTGLIMGAGMVIAGVGGFIAALSPEAMVVIGGAIALSAIGEALFTPLALSRLSRGLPWRAQTAAVAAWIAATSLPGFAFAALPAAGETAGRVVVAVLAFLSVAAGIATVAGFRFLDRAFTPETA